MSGGCLIAYVGQRGYEVSRFAGAEVLRKVAAHYPGNAGVVFVGAVDITEAIDSETCRADQTAQHGDPGARPADRNLDH